MERESELDGSGSPRKGRDDGERRFQDAVSENSEDEGVTQTPTLTRGIKRKGSDLDKSGDSKKGDATTPGLTDVVNNTQAEQKMEYLEDKVKTLEQDIKTIHQEIKNDKEERHKQASDCFNNNVHDYSQNIYNLIQQMRECSIKMISLLMQLLTDTDAALLLAKMEELGFDMSTLAAKMGRMTTRMRFMLNPEKMMSMLHTLHGSHHLSRRGEHETTDTDEVSEETLDNILQSRESHHPSRSVEQESTHTDEVSEIASHVSDIGTCECCGGSGLDWNNEYRPFGLCWACTINKCDCSHTRKEVRGF